MPSLNPKSKEITFKHLRDDLPAGLVVYFVALPLCMGIALASGVPVFSGIIAGLIGGTVVSFLSGSNLSVTGPAAGLTVIVLDSVKELGSLELFFLAVMIGGAIQLVLGFLKAGIIGYYFPSSVIKGMLAAIGIILILKQLPHLVGFDKDNEGDFAFFQADGENTFSEIINSLNFFHPGAIIISGVSLFILILWELPRFKKLTIFKIVPGALLVVVAGIAINEFFKSSAPTLFLSGEEMVSLPVSDSASGFVSQFKQPDFSGFGNPHVYVVAITLAIVASLETLLSVEAVDKLDPQRRSTPTNRELKAQGVGNMLSGMLGGLPMTAVIVRGSANVNAGAKTKLSAIIHGLLLLLSVVVFPTIMNKIPIAALAALLLVVGYKLARIPLFMAMAKLSWDQFLPFIVTVVSIQFSDLLTGVGIGMAVAIFFILRNNYKRAYFYKAENHKEGEKITITLAQEVTFLNKGSISLTLDHLPENSSVIINGTDSLNIDSDVLELIHEFKATAKYRNISVELVGIPDFKGMAGH